MGLPWPVLYVTSHLVSPLAKWWRRWFKRWVSLFILGPSCFWSCPFLSSSTHCSTEACSSPAGCSIPTHLAENSSSLSLTLVFSPYPSLKICRSPGQSWVGCYLMRFPGSPFPSRTLALPEVYARIQKKKQKWQCRPWGKSVAQQSRMIPALEIIPIGNHPDQGQSCCSDIYLWWFLWILRIVCKSSQEQ